MKMLDLGSVVACLCVSDCTLARSRVLLCDEDQNFRICTFSIIHFLSKMHFYQEGLSAREANHFRIS